MTTFEEAWKIKEAEGYRYGPDALENVRFGWQLAVEHLMSNVIPDADFSEVSSDPFVIGNPEGPVIEPDVAPEDPRVLLGTGKLYFEGRELGAVVGAVMVDATDAHVWVEKFNLTCCQKCGIVRRADCQNKPCCGTVKLVLRDSDG